MMAVRATMLPLIQMLRDLTGAASDGDVAWTDQQIQNFLDKRRTQVRYLCLNALEFLQPGGRIVYLEFDADDEYWEADATLYDASYNDVTLDATPDYLTGRWVFAQPQLPLIYLIGKTYDVYGAAGDLCEAWASALARDYDFSDKQVSLKRSQASAGLRAMADAFKRQARPRAAMQVRSDVEDGNGNSGLQSALNKILTNPF